ncbi:MAG: sulfotransferase [Gammaproteobacteria bacterium]|nr:sulfotransferase [Gammaproteobacteria bacterium]
MTIKVIGTGLGLTGTASPKLALEHLDLDPWYHMGEILPKAQVFEQQILLLPL